MTPTEAPDAGAASLRSARIKLAIILLAPFLVVGLATLVYFTGVGIPSATTNKGTLLIPPRQIDELGLRDADGAPWRYETDGAGWGILVAGREQCADTCRERLHLARQSHRALGREQGRVTRYYLDTAETLEPSTVAYLRSEHEGLRVLHAPEQALRTLLARQGDPEPLDAGTIYLVDPRGFVMMYYLPGHPERGIIDDLRFLLKNSSE